MNEKTILVIEDDFRIQEFLCNAVLTPAGYDVLTASDGQEGLERALTERPDVILLDLMLPRLSGLNVMSILQKQNCHIPTIVLTAYSSEQEILKAFRLGAKDFLQKPFTVEDVWAAIEKALAEERLRQERENLTQALAQANQRLQQQVQNWATLNDIARAISATLEEPEVFRRVVQNITRILQIEACSLLLVDQETSELDFVVTLKGDQARYSAFRLKPGQGIAGWVARHGEPLLIPDVTKDSRFYAQVDQSTGFESRSILCVPLKAKGRVIGVLEAINKRGQAGAARFTEEDLEMLTALASWVAVAVENARLNRATRDMAAAAALKQTVTAMAHHINNRLTAFSLELDGLEIGGTVDQQAVGTIIASARRSIQEVSAVIKALDRLEEIHTIPYVGEAEMIDIEDALREQLSKDVQASLASQRRPG
ncbi:MAG: response regulator [Anaerolineae bacterium]|jgi:DNA-binding response OmpR family regulator